MTGVVGMKALEELQIVQHCVHVSAVIQLLCFLPDCSVVAV